MEVPGYRASGTAGLGPEALSNSRYRPGPGLQLPLVSGRAAILIQECICYPVRHGVGNHGDGLNFPIRLISRQRVIHAGDKRQPFRRCTASGVTAGRDRQFCGGGLCLVPDAAALQRVRIPHAALSQNTRAAIHGNIRTSRDAGLNTNAKGTEAWT